MKSLLITAIAALLLVGCGESPKAPDISIHQPDISIHQAVIVGNIETVKQHLAAGTDVNAKNWGDGSTPLHGAAFNGHKEMAELLLSNGAEVNARLESVEHKGLTPLDVAELPSENDSPEMIVAKKEFSKFLRKHGGQTLKELGAAEPVAEAAKPEPSTGKAPDASLWGAAMSGEIELAKKAIDDGANVNAKKEDGQTPLHFAVVAALDSGDNKVIELLIANGADVNAKDDSGLTPLDSVKRLSEAAAITKKLRAILGKTDDIPVADLLRKHGGKTGAELKAEGK